jgi:hypothetical protein
MAGPVAKEKGRAAAQKKKEETARCRDDGKSGGGLRELELRKRFKRFLSE